MLQLRANPSLMAYSIALVFILGKVPGCASVMGLICVLGQVLKAALSPQNNLLLVSNWVCTSNPITTWYLLFCFTAAKVRSDGQLAMSSDRLAVCSGRQLGSFLTLNKKSVLKISERLLMLIHGLCRLYYYLVNYSLLSAQQHLIHIIIWKDATINQQSLIFQGFLYQNSWHYHYATP